jgi:uncharacterized protein
MDITRESVSDMAALQAIYKPPRRAPDVLVRLDSSCRYFITRAPIAFLATSHPERGVNVSPRGDAPGFVRVLDDNTLAIPDRAGNSRLDSMTNILADNRIGLFLMIPGVNEALRIKGTAEIVRDSALLAAATVDEKEPSSVMIVTVESAFIHCGKALSRAHLWDSTYRVDPGTWLEARVSR